MLEMIVFTSFIIHAATLIALYILFKDVRKRKNVQMNEMESVMASYVEQIRKENNELQVALRMPTPPREIDKKYQPVQMNKYSPSHTLDQQTSHSGEWNAADISLQTKEDTAQTTLESRVLHLHQVGLPVDEIAKQLHCGKTEASLIIQFQHNKQ